MKVKNFGPLGLVIINDKNTLNFYIISIIPLLSKLVPSGVQTLQMSFEHFYRIRILSLL